MGLCEFCHKPAGWFRHAHKECTKRYEDTWSSMLVLASTSLQHGQTDGLEQQLENLASNAGIPRQNIRTILHNAWEQGVDAFLNDNFLSPEEEVSLLDFSKRFQLTRDELDANGALTRVVKAGII